MKQYQVHAAGTQRAIRTGIGMCQMLERGEKPHGFSPDESQCVLEGIAGVRTDDGLRLLANNCRK